jgi:hypothetical protein
MTYRVFVSHASKDRAWLEWIKGRAGPGVELWLAEHDPQPGTNLPTKVQRVDRSQAVMVFITEAAQASPYVQQEIGWALKAKKPVIPVVQIGISSNELAMLQGAEYVEFHFNDPEKGRDALLTHLQVLAQKKKASDDLQTALLLVAALTIVGLVASSSGSGSASI